jgi:TldD protein
VLPEFLDVVDDPSLKTYEGKGLLGAYAIDDEGATAEAVNLVTDGKLAGYLIGREPVRDFAESNGHARGGITGAPHPVIGVLKITAKDGVPDKSLEKMLVDLGKKQALDCVYFVQTMGGELTPRMLYRITADGKRELVRGAELDDLDQRALRSSLVAAGNSLFVDNSFGDTPETVVAPALLLSDVTVRRANEKNDKLPFYPPPD